MSNTSRIQILIVAPGEDPGSLLERALALAHCELRVPHEVHVIGHPRVLAAIERELLPDSSKRTRFGALCARLGLSRDEILFNRRTLHSLQIEPHGSRTCGAAVDDVVRLVRQLRSDSGAAVTAVLARDAALPGLVLHAALQFAGRRGDRLLMEGPAPPHRGRTAAAASPRWFPLDFPLLLPEDGERLPGTYTDAVREREVERRRLEQPDVLRLDCARRLVAVGETSVHLPAMQFFWLYYLASTPGERFPLSELSALLEKPQRQPVSLVQRLADGRSRSLPSDLQRTFTRLFPFAADKFDAMLQRSCGAHPGLPSTISKINAALRRALGRGAEPYLIEGGRGSGGYRLNLSADRVELVNTTELRRA